jgi:hypothetical protein
VPRPWDPMLEEVSRTTCPTDHGTTRLQCLVESTATTVEPILFDLMEGACGDEASEPDALACAKQAKQIVLASAEGACLLPLGVSGSFAAADHTEVQVEHVGGGGVAGS